MNRRLLLACSAVLLIFAALGGWLYFRPEPFTEDTLANIEIGMPIKQVRDLLGRPSYSARIMGKVEGPTRFAANPDPEVQKRENYQDYAYHQFDRAERSIIVVTDEENRVACRYLAKRGGDR